MSIPAATIAAYAPWGNAELAFSVGTGAATVDPTTGNYVQSTETLEYLAALEIQPPSWDAKPGADVTAYQCRGRLLSPNRLDSRVTNGSQAEATINGLKGRLELTFPLNMDRAAYRDLRQEISGTFRISGGPN